MVNQTFTWETAGNHQTTIKNWLALEFQGVIKGMIITGGRDFLYQVVWGTRYHLYIEEVTSCHV